MVIMADVDVTEMRRLQWQCRRGMLELDVLLERFLTHDYPTLATSERQTFERLLHCTDQDLWQWLIVGEACGEQELQKMVARILKAQ